MAAHEPATHHSAAAAHAGGAHAVAHPADPAAERETLLLGIRLFILSEVMLFGALFTAYFVLRFQAPAWPPQADVERPELLLVGFNTLLLVASSVTLQWATSRIAKGDAAGLRRGLAATLILGTAFIAIQGYEFATNGFGISDGIFGSTFYTLTGFHGAHVLGGLLLIGAVANRARLGLIDQARHTAVEGVGLYWHFVDVVWICLFLSVYVL